MRKLFCGDEVVVDGLAAAQQIHIRIGADLGEDIRSLLGVLFLHIGAVVDGDVFLALVTDLFGQGAQQHLDITAGAEQSAAVESQVVALVDIVAVEIGVPARM